VLNFSTHVLIPKLIMLAECEVLRSTNVVMARILTQEIAHIFETKKKFLHICENGLSGYQQALMVLTPHVK
jgi:hypothetical protein